MDVVRPRGLVRGVDGGRCCQHRAGRHRSPDGIRGDPASLLSIDQHCRFRAGHPVGFRKSRLRPAHLTGNEMAAPAVLVGADETGSDDHCHHLQYFRRRSVGRAVHRGHEQRSRDKPGCRPARRRRISERRRLLVHDVGIDHQAVGRKRPGLPIPGIRNERPRLRREWRGPRSPPVGRKPTHPGSRRCHDDHRLRRVRRPTGPAGGPATAPTGTAAPRQSRAW